MASNRIASNEGARHVARFTLKIGQGVTAYEIRIIRIFFLLFLPDWVDSSRRDARDQERPEVVNNPMVASQASAIHLYDEWWRQAVLPCLLTLEGQAWGFSLGVQLAFSARGKRKETDWKARFYRDFIAIFHDYSATLPIVWRLRSNRRSIATK